MIGLTVFTLASLWCGLTAVGRAADRGPGGPGARRLDDHAADDGDHHPHLPGRPPRQGDGAVGRHRRRRHAGRPDPGRRPGRRARLGVDLLHQRPGRASSACSSPLGWCRRWRPTPTRSTGSGVALSGAGMFLLVFGIQEGHQYHWSTAIWAMIVVRPRAPRPVRRCGRRATRQEPLVPLGLFRDRNFSLANVNISVMGFAITALAIPLLLWAQVVRGLSPTRSALLLVPMAIMTILLARPVGNLTDRAHPRMITAFGFAATIVSLVWLSHEMTPDVSDRGADRPDGAARHRQRVHLGAQLRDRDPQPARSSRPAPAPASTTPPVRSAPCSARPRSRC